VATIVTYIQTVPGPSLSTDTY